MVVWPWQKTSSHLGTLRLVRNYPISGHWGLLRNYSIPGYSDLRGSTSRRCFRVQKIMGCISSHVGNQVASQGPTSGQAQQRKKACLSAWVNITIAGLFQPLNQNMRRQPQNLAQWAMGEKHRRKAFLLCHLHLCCSPSGREGSEGKSWLWRRVCDCEEGPEGGLGRQVVVLKTSRRRGASVGTLIPWEVRSWVKEKISMSWIKEPPHHGKPNPEGKPFMDERGNINALN